MPHSAPGEAVARGAASSLSRAIDVLGLFSLDSPVLRIEDVTTRLGYTRSTAYRYVKELCDADLLTPMFDRGYTLGSRILEMERLLELTDPLYRAGRQVLGPMHRPDCVYMLQSMHRDRVICIYQEGPEVLVHDKQRVALNRARGVPFPLFRGAASLAILAWQSPHRIKHVYLREPGPIAEAGLGDDWPSFRRRLAAIRRDGYACNRVGNPTLFALAVPILLPNDGRVIGSLSQVFAHPVAEDSDTATLPSMLAAALEIARRFEHLARPAMPGSSPTHRTRRNAA